VAGASCTFTFVFTPTKDATQNSTCTLTDSASSSPQIYDLYGAGVASASEASPAEKNGTQTAKPADDDDDD
jgi:hypothetical protein